MGEDMAPFHQATMDEQIVNMALVNYLNALSVHCKSVKGKWSIHRYPFQVYAPDHKIYEARVDGYLRYEKEKMEIRAIAEVKPGIRYRTKTYRWAIQMQETAQMAAWISHHPPSLEDKNKGSMM